MATRHRERLNIHLLESDRANLLSKASQNMSKLHAWDLTEEERAGAQSTSTVLVRLKNSKDRLFTLMQEERSRFASLISGIIRITTRLVDLQIGSQPIQHARFTLKGILNRSHLRRREVLNLIVESRQNSLPLSQKMQLHRVEQLSQRR